MIAGLSGQVAALTGLGGGVTLGHRSASLAYPALESAFSQGVDTDPL